MSPEGLLNQKLRYFHDNHEDTVFPVTRPHPLNTYQELLAAPVVPPLAAPTRWMVIGEENGFFPYSTRVVAGMEDIEVRQRRRLEYQDVGRQNAELRSIRSALGSPWLTAFAFIAAGVVVMMVCIIAAALVLFRFGGDGPAASAGLLALLGVTAASGPRARSRRRKPEPAPVAPDGAVGKVPRWSVYLYDTIDGRKKHYSLPYPEIAANINSEAYRFPALQSWRWIMAAGLGVLPVAGASALFGVSPALAISAVFLSLPVALVLALLGYCIGPAVARLDPLNRPHCVVYRGLTSNREIVITPYRYTSLTGVDPFIWEDLINGNLAQAQEKAQEAGYEQMPQFDPIVNRADDAWEDVHGLLEREDVRIPMTTAQRIQLGSMVVMAAGSVIIAILVVLITAGG